MTTAKQLCLQSTNDSQIQIFCEHCSAQRLLAVPVVRLSKRSYCFYEAVSYACLFSSCLPAISCQMFLVNISIHV